MRKFTAARRAGGFAAVALAATLALTGCAAPDTTPSKTVMTASQGGALTTVTYYAEGDLLTKQRTQNVVEYAASGIADKAAAEVAVGELIDQYKGIEGVQHTIDFGETSLTETVTITYKNLDAEKLAKANGGEVTSTNAEARKVSLSDAVASLEAAGFTKAQ